MEMIPFKQGAEAKLYKSSYYGKDCVIKERFPKSYRHPTLDKSLNVQRTKAEVRAMLRCQLLGIPTPTLYMVNMENNTIYMEFIKNSVSLRNYIEDTQQQSPISNSEILIPLAEVIGKLLAKMHNNNLVHGDLTTSNMLLRGSPEKRVVVMIDFGLSYGTTLAEDKGVDLYVLERALLSTHPKTEFFFEAILNAYKKDNKNGARDVLNKLDEIRQRGRKRTMVG